MNPLSLSTFLSGTFRILKSGNKLTIKYCLNQVKQGNAKHKNAAVTDCDHISPHSGYISEGQI